MCKLSSKSKKRRVSSTSGAESTASGSQSEGENDPHPPPEVLLRKTHRRIRKLLRKSSRKAAADEAVAQRGKTIPFDVTALDDFIRCIPLTRIIFGDFHWRLARSYADLALAYLDLMQLPIQSQEHAVTAKTLLTQNVHLSDNPLEKVMQEVK